MYKELIERITEAREHTRLHGDRLPYLWTYHGFAINVGELFNAIEALQARVAELEYLDTQRLSSLRQVEAERNAAQGVIETITKDQTWFELKAERDALAAELAAARAQEPLTDATKASCALGYEECSHRCGTPHVCCDHYVEPEPIATPIPPVREPVAWRWRMNGQWHYGPEPLFKDGFTTQEPLYDKPIPPAQEPLSDNAILRIYNKVGQEDGAPYRFAGAIEAAIKEQA